MNNFAQENNLQCCLNLCGPTLLKEITCAILAHGKQTTFLSKINYTMLCLSSWDNITQKYCLVNVVKYVWDSIPQEIYLRNVGPERTDILPQKNRLFQICLVACLLTGHNITEQSWLFLFNVELRVHLRLAGQQWTETDIDWNKRIDINVIPYNVQCTST